MYKGHLLLLSRFCVVHVAGLWFNLKYSAGKMRRTHQDIKRSFSTAAPQVGSNRTPGVFPRRRVLSHYVHVVIIYSKKRINR